MGSETVRCHRLRNVHDAIFVDQNVEWAGPFSGEPAHRRQVAEVQQTQFRSTRRVGVGDGRLHGLHSKMTSFCATAGKNGVAPERVSWIAS